MAKNKKMTASPEQIAAARAALQPTTYRDYAEYNDDYTMSSIDSGTGRGNTQQAKRRQDDFLNTNPLGAPWAYEERNWFESFMDDTFEDIMVGVVGGGVLAVGGSLLFGAGGAGSAASAASASGATAGTSIAAGEAAAGLGGLGAAGTAGTAGTALAGAIPQVIITGAAPAAAGIGAGTAAIGAAGLGGLAAMTGGGAPAAGAVTPEGPMQVVEVPGVAEAGVGLGGVAAGVGLAGLGAAALGTNAAALETLPAVVAGPATPGTGIVGAIPPAIGAIGDAIDGIGDVLGPLAPWLGAANDYKNSKEDQEFWKSKIDTLEGMYKPGTLEAEQMRQRMEARDAASGRRSQYGMREVNLASNLAEKRAGIMTSAGYQNMANAYRNRDSQSLNSLFAAAGGAGQPQGAGGGLGGLLNGVGNTISAGQNLWGTIGNLFS